MPGHGRRDAPRSHGRSSLAAGGAARAAALAVARRLRAARARRAATAPPARPARAAASRPAAGYDARRDSLDSVDATVLRGRRIVLDPGHGGFFPGSHRRRRADRGRGQPRRGAGAARPAGGARRRRCSLTRDTDRDFLTPGDSSLRADLAERVRIANAFAPDLFVLDPPQRRRGRRARRQRDADLLQARRRGPVATTPRRTCTARSCATSASRRTR